MPSKVIIIDYGSQVTQLIARRVREAGVYSEIHPCVVTAAQVKAMQPSAIILSGGPASVGEKDAPALDKGFLDLGVPVLGFWPSTSVVGWNSPKPASMAPPTCGLSVPAPCGTASI